MRKFDPYQRSHRQRTSRCAQQKRRFWQLDPQPQTSPESTFSPRRTLKKVLEGGVRRETTHAHHQLVQEKAARRFQGSRKRLHVPHHKEKPAATAQGRSPAQATKNCQARSSTRKNCHAVSTSEVRCVEVTRDRNGTTVHDTCACACTVCTSCMWRVRPLCCAVLRCAVLCSAPLATLSVHSIPFHSIPFHSIPFHFISFHSIPFHSIPFHSIPFHSIPFHSFIHIPPRGHACGCAGCACVAGVRTRVQRALGVCAVVHEALMRAWRKMRV